jgi:hypothetical protein
MMILSLRIVILPSTQRDHFQIFRLIPGYLTILEGKSKNTCLGQRGALGIEVRVRHRHRLRSSDLYVG